MVGAGYCSREKLRIHRIATNVKVNAAYYQENVAGPISNDEITRLYGGDASNIWIHMV